MKKNIFLFLFILVSNCLLAQTTTSEYFELRVYTCNEGKLKDLLARFQNHTMGIFEKHGMQNIAYWTPLKENNNQLYYILGYPNKEARDLSWKAFSDDPEWKEVFANSRKNGPIVNKVESRFMVLNKDLTDRITVPQNYSPRVFELRNYKCLDEKFPDLVKRFKDHTRDIFMAHGITNVFYFNTIEDPGVQSDLLYVISHSSLEAAKKNWEDFRADPNWITVKNKSEENGKIVKEVISTFMDATEFSPIK